MDDNEAAMKMECTNSGSWAPSRDDPTSTYTELDIREVDRLTNTRTDDLDPTYSHLNFRQHELLVAKEEDHPIASGPEGMPVTAQAGAQKQEQNQNIRNRPDRKTCLLCLVTFALIVTVAGLSIHVSQIRQSLTTLDRNYRGLWEQHEEMKRIQRQNEQQVLELNSTLESSTSEKSRLDLSHRNCLMNLPALKNNLTNRENNIFVLNSDLSELNRTYSDLVQQFKQLKMKYRNLNETKANICQILTRRIEQTCFQNWIKNEDRCYFLPKITDTYDGARQHCSEHGASLLEINSDKEKDFVSRSISSTDGTYWIGKCTDGNVASSLLYKMYYGSLSCRECGWGYTCKGNYRFICEKSAHLYPDIPEEIRGLCQQPVGPTPVK